MAAKGRGEQVFFGLLVVSFPLALLAHFLHWPYTIAFAICCAAILPLAHYVGEATEVLAHRLGSGLGSLLNATFGNAAELILAFAALRAGKLQMVKASLSGSILVNLLLILGVSMFAGGLGRVEQSFNPTAAMAGLIAMYLAIVSMTLPDLFHLALGDAALPRLLPLSVGISAVMLAVYALSLYFSVRTHAHLYTDEKQLVEDLPWSSRKATAILVAATLGTVLVAEFLVEAVEGTFLRWGLSETFVGVIVLSVVGSAAEHLSAVSMARKGNMSLAFSIVFESSKQIALFVAPALVLLSLVSGPAPLTLEFSHLEVVALAIAVGGATLAALDGRSNWLEGVMLLAVYLILAVMFFLVP